MSYQPFPDFVEVARDVFRFLENDYGFVLDPAGKSDDKWTADVRFKNETTFVDVNLERRDSQIILFVGPLHEGQVPPRPRDWFDLGGLLLVRGIPFPTHRGRLTKIRNGAGRKRELEEWGVALRIAAEDLLQGDFEVVPLLNGIIRERQKYKWEPSATRGRLL